MLARLFVVYFLCLFLPLSALTIALTHGQLRAERVRYEDALRDETGSVAKAVGEKLASFVATGNTVFSARWYSHYNMESLLYQDEFDYLKQLEITSDICAKIVAMEYVYDMLVIVPAFDQVIHRVGWYPTKSYQSYYGDVVIDMDEATGRPLVTLAESKRDAYFLIVLSDPVPRYRKAVIAILVNKRSYASYAGRRLSDARYACIAVGDQVLYTSGDASAEGTAVTASTAGAYAMTCTCVYPAFDEGRGILPEYATRLAVVLLLSVLVALMLLRKHERSLRPLLARFPEVRFGTDEDAYRYIGSYIDGVSSVNLRMRQENDRLAQRLERLMEGMRNELLLGMLRNPEFDFDQMLSIPWLNAKQPCVLFYIRANAEKRFELTGELCAYGQSVALSANETCLVAWFRDAADAEARAPRISCLLEAGLEGAETCGRSPVIGDIREIREALSLLTQRMRPQARAERRKHDDVAAQIRAFIDACYCAPDVSMKLLEERFGLDGAMISKKFKAETGETFSDYLQARRMDAAKLLMVRTDQVLNDIAEAVGYVSYLSFKRAFLRANGVSPKEWRARTPEAKKDAGEGDERLADVYVHYYMRERDAHAERTPSEIRRQWFEAHAESAD